MKAYFWCMITILGLSFSVTAQHNITTPEINTNPLYQKNIGKLVFLSKSIPSEQLTESDFLESFQNSDGNDLYLGVFMGNSLVNFLHTINPNLTVAELVQSGNFQFSFYADDKLLYTENLNTGAGTLQSKTKGTTFQIPLISKSGEDSWGRFLWSRFFFNGGGEEALFSGEHKLTIEIRPYLKSGTTIKTGALIAQGSLIVTAPIVSLSENQIAIQKIAPKSDWPLATATYDTTTIRLLNQKIQEKRFKDITSIVVIQNGKLAIEEYFNGSDRNTLHNTRSVGKSFASTLVGMAIRDGYIKNENQTLNPFYKLKDFAHYSISKENVTLKSLLTMSSGFDGSDQNPDSPGNEENMYPTDNWVKFALDLPMDSEKQIGKNWDYFTAGVVLLGDILNQRVPKGLESYAATKLFNPLGIKSYQWQYTPQNVANTAGGLQLRTLDLARYGQLYANKGLWNGKQLLPKEWVEKSFTNYFPEDSNTPGYGYLFWKENFTVKGKNYDAFACSGNGGNKVYIFQNVPLVIVITATAYNKPYTHPQVRRMMQEFLLPALIAEQ